MTMDIETIRRIARDKMTKAAVANAKSVLVALDDYGARFGLNQPHRVAQYLAQIMHESGEFRYDREVWGPTPAQKRYEGRADLGNTQPGDGKKFAGHTGIQITGRANTREFRDWCRKHVSADAPDFEENPKLMNTDPWEGLGPIWYWDTRKLNKYADQGDIEMITKRVNGGLNGYADRLELYTRAALVMLGYAVNDVKDFQKDVGLFVDGDPGPRTRAKLHEKLVRLTDKVFRNKDVQSAPVTEEKPVVPEKVEEKVKQNTGAGGWLIGILTSLGAGVTKLMDADWTTVIAIGGVGIVALGILIVAHKRIIAAIKDIRQEVER